MALTLAALVGGESAKAALVMNGSLGVTDFPGGGSYSSSSLMLTTPTLVTTSETGIFASFVPAHSDVTSYTGTLTGLSATPSPENINDFFLFSTPDSTFGTTGTTPNNRFDFVLSSIVENPSGVFFGRGTLVDSTSAYATSYAIFTLSFSGQGSYSFTLATVPEPDQYGIYGSALACLPVVFGLFHRRFSSRAC